MTPVTAVDSVRVNVLGERGRTAVHIHDTVDMTSGECTWRSMISRRHIPRNRELFDFESRISKACSYHPDKQKKLMCSYSSMIVLIL